MNKRRTNHGHALVSDLLSCMYTFISKYKKIKMKIPFSFIK